jgi:hypothetical protein
MIEDHGARLNTISSRLCVLTIGASRERVTVNRERLLHKAHLMAQKTFRLFSSEVDAFHVFDFIR